MNNEFNEMKKNILKNTLVEGAFNLYVSFLGVAVTYSQAINDLNEFQKVFSRSVKNPEKVKGED